MGPRDGICPNVSAIFEVVQRMGMEVVVGFLIAWAAGRARRVGRRINGLTDQALDHAVDQVWLVIAAKLGADPAIQRLVTEARETGDASVEIRADAARVLQQTADGDPEFAARLRSAASAADSETGRNNWTGTNSGVTFGSVTAGGSVTIKNKVTNYVKRNPLVAVAVTVAVLLIAVWLVASALSKPNISNDTMVGTWASSDGTGTKIFTGKGPCDGFYYNNGAPLDIGGPMTCALSSKPDAQGFYSLTVSQAPNQSSYKIQFDSVDHAVVYTNRGQRLYELSRS